MPNTSNMSKGQLRLFIERVMREGQAIVFSSDNILYGTGFTNDIIVQQGVTLTIAEGEVITIMPLEIGIFSRRSTT
jgi:hypothetical protein